MDYFSVISRLISRNLLIYKGGAGDQNRTDVTSLGSSCSTIELHPRAPVKRKWFVAGLGRNAKEFPRWLSFLFWPGQSGRGGGLRLKRHRMPPKEATEAESVVDLPAGLGREWEGWSWRFRSLGFPVWEGVVRHCGEKVSF